MAVTRVTQGNFANASRTSIVFTIPASALTGDEIVFLIEQDGNGTAPSTPSGWSQVNGSPLVGASAARESCYVYKVQASDVPGTTTYTFTWTTADFSAGMWAMYRGQDQTTPQDVAAGNGTFNGSASCVVTGVTTVTPNAMVIVLEGEQGVGASHTGPGSEAVDIDGGSLYDFVQASPGATGNQTVTLSGASGGGGFVVVLRPAAAAGGAPTRVSIANPRVGPMALRHNYRFRRPPTGTSVVSTPVSNTVDTLFEALQGIVQNAADPVEAAQQLVTTAIDPLEAVQSVVTSASDPLEETGGIAATAADPVEALAGVAAPLVDPFESIRGGISTTSLVPFEALQGILQSLVDALEATGGSASTGIDPLEALRGIAAPQSDPIESSTGLSTTSSDPFEASQGIATTILVAFEATGGIASSALDPFEALAAIAAALSDPYEAAGVAVTAVSATSQVPFEALRGIAQALGVPLEALGGVASAKSDPIDSVAGVAVNSIEPFESLGGLRQTTVVPLEALGGIAGSSGDFYEALAAAVALSTAPFEGISTFVYLRVGELVLEVAVLRPDARLRRVAPGAPILAVRPVGLVRPQAVPAGLEAVELEARISKS